MYSVACRSDSGRAPVTRSGHLQIAHSCDLALLCVNRVAGHLHFARRSFRRFGPAVRQPRCGAFALCMLPFQAIWPRYASTSLRGDLPFACCSFRRFGPAVRQPRCGAFALCTSLFQAIGPRCASTALRGICTLHVALSGDLISLCADHAAGNLHIWHCGAPQLQQQ